MAATGFEGFEKRLELHFNPVHSSSSLSSPLGLRLLLDFDSLVEVLNAVQCTVVAAVGNRYFDAYVLSESSLFVYPNKIIIKTCGTTQLLKSIRPLIRLANSDDHLSLCALRYTRGSFIFPDSQPSPHTSFSEEAEYIRRRLPPSLRCRKASVMPSKLTSHSWHVFTATTDDYQTEMITRPDDKPIYTVEVCMTDLDRTRAGKFFQPKGKGRNGDVPGKEMTKLTGIGEINRRAIICDFGFDPCGYSMNGIDQEWYSTIHVTPEDGYSYASYEWVGSTSDDDVVEVLNKVVRVFRPGTMSVSTTGAKREVWGRVGHALEGMKRRSCAVDEYPAFGTVVYQTFTAGGRRKEVEGN
ncbi:S-adenosylmethionine decarboxylase proenzyme 4 [Linum grandiflorum]